MSDVTVFKTWGFGVIKVFTVIPNSDDNKLEAFDAMHTWCLLMTTTRSTYPFVLLSRI